MKLFQPVPVFLKLSTNTMEVIRLDSMKSIHRVSKIPFSNSRITLADFHVANTFLNEILNELIEKKLGFRSKWNVIVQQIDKCEGGLSIVELRTIRDVCEHSGADSVKIIEKENPISAREVKTNLSRLLSV